jgi:formylglycine-generating enzyme required for sulfatase activity
MKYFTKLSWPFVIWLGALLIMGGCEDEEATPSGIAWPLPILDPADSSRVIVPAGFCVLGNNPEGWGNYTITDNPVWVDSFSLDRWEVTNQQYADFLDSALSDCTVFFVDGNIFDAPMDGELLIKISNEFSHLFYADSTDLIEVDAGFEQMPVTLVSWFGATAFADYYGRRLPTEAEWEKAARGASGAYGGVDGAGVGFAFPWGQAQPDASLANFGDSNGSPEPVESYPSGVSWFGAYQMAGNVSEWTATSIGSARVHRGGSFASDAEFLHTAARAIADPATTHRTLGFRCVGGN